VVILYKRDNKNGENFEDCCKKKHGFSTFLRGCNPDRLIFRYLVIGIGAGDGTIKSVHIQGAKIKQFLQSRKYIYFWRQKIYLVERESVIYY
jgi:hypothetical protein